jgi:hypothetical protein
VLAVGLTGFTMIVLAAVFFMRHPRSRGDRIGGARAGGLLAVLVGLALVLLFVVSAVSRGSV